MSNCLIIQEKQMNDIVKQINENTQHDFTFVWCPEYCNLVDFNTNGEIKRLNYKNSLMIILNYLDDIIDDDDFKNTFVKNNENVISVYPDSTELYHDSSRKIYILTW